MMIFAFETLEDFKAINPQNYGLDDKFILSLNLQDETMTLSLVHDMNNYSTYVNKESFEF